MGTDTCQRLELGDKQGHGHCTEPGGLHAELVKRALDKPGRHSQIREGGELVVYLLSDFAHRLLPEMGGVSEMRRRSCVPQLTRGRVAGWDTEGLKTLEFAHQCGHIRALFPELLGNAPIVVFDLL
jgi:hypothetical protein